MKKFTSALLAVTALTAANVFAAGAVDSKTGAYLGGNVGMANTNVKYGYSNDNSFATLSGAALPALTAARAQNYKAEAGKLNPLFGLFAGYGMQVGTMYFGGEVYGGFDSAKVSPYDDSATGASAGYWKTSVKRTNFYGLAPRIGFFVTPSTMLYVKLGIEGGKWTAQVDPNAASIDGSAANADQKAASKKQFNSTKNPISFVPGLGLDAFITKNLFLRAEYTYLFGPKMTVNQNVDGYQSSLVEGTG
ncbi:MAG: outer membrane beta-barrel protein, partial [Pseudomonadota bacterium]|nr:outer membrane beta-barrel protein [Pseudomonadota bacterium]